MFMAGVITATISRYAQKIFMLLNSLASYQRISISLAFDYASFCGDTPKQCNGAFASISILKTTRPELSNSPSFISRSLRSVSYESKKQLLPPPNTMSVTVSVTASVTAAPSAEPYAAGKLLRPPHAHAFSSSGSRTETCVRRDPRLNVSSQGSVVLQECSEHLDLNDRDESPAESAGLRFNGAKDRLETGVPSFDPTDWFDSVLRTDPRSATTSDRCCGYRRFGCVCPSNESSSRSCAKSMYTVFMYSECRGGSGSGEQTR